MTIQQQLEDLKAKLEDLQVEFEVTLSTKSIKIDNTAPLRKMIWAINDIGKYAPQWIRNITFNGDRSKIGTSITQIFENATNAELTGNIEEISINADNNLYFAGYCNFTQCIAWNNPYRDTYPTHIITMNNYLELIHYVLEDYPTGGIRVVATLLDIFDTTD
jgi:hypothetical protein